MTLSNDTFGLG